MDHQWMQWLLVLKEKYGIYTNEKGEFSFNANPGNYIILFSYMGSKPIEKAVNLASIKQLT
jgi:hypothetical protein